MVQSVAWVLILAVAMIERAVSMVLCTVAILLVYDAVCLESERGMRCTLG